MSKFEELSKAIEEAGGTIEGLLRKSQMGFDFGAATTLNPHHAAYARRNARGTVSQIEAKGTPVPEHHAMVKELHDAFERHDKRGRRGMGINTEHPDYSTPEKYLQTAKNILKYRGHERLGVRGRDEVAGILVRHIKQLAQDHDEQPVTIQAAKVDAGHRIPPSPEVAHLITQVDAAATGLLAHPQMQQHRAEVETMLRELKQYPSARHAKAIIERLKDMGEEVQEPMTIDDAKGKITSEWIRKGFHTNRGSVLRELQDWDDEEIIKFAKQLK
jgi:hypothetical protein